MGIRIMVRRHAERPGNKALLHALRVSLTSRGQKQAQQAGRQLRRTTQGNTSLLFTSTPSDRTHETAREMMTGGNFPGKNHPLRKLTGLFRPEVKRDPHLRAKAGELLHRTNQELIRDWLAGKIDPAIVHTPAEEIQRGIRYLKRARQRSLKSGSKKIHIVNINHDSVMIAFLHEMTGFIPKRIRWRTRANPSMMDYLEGFDLSLGKKVILTFRGKRHDITDKFDEWAKRTK